MFVSYNLDFVTASSRLTHLLLTTGFLGLAAGLVLYVLKLLEISRDVQAISAPAAILLSSLSLVVMAVIWREVIQAQRFAKGVPPFLIRRIWSTGTVPGDSHPEGVTS